MCVIKVDLQPKFDVSRRYHSGDLCVHTNIPHGLSWFIFKLRSILIKKGEQINSFFFTFYIF